MARHHHLLAALLGLTAFASLAPRAHAQGPDVRDVRPIVMLLVDSSGSMERRGDCVCTTASCSECLPSCGASSQRNRWATVLEALTGSWDGFQCLQEDRRHSSYAGQPDYRYFIPHILHPGETRLIGGTVFAPTITQRADGILDSYADRVKFGLMTFDGVSTRRDDSMLVPERIFNVPTYLSDSAGAMGGFSYGEPRPFGFPGCGEPYMIDNGAQSDAPGGTLVSVGSDLADFDLINARIQDTLLRTRPFGPTPISGMLADFEYYLNHHPDVARISTPGGAGDAFQQCRPRYAILLSDGYPNADMRGAPYNCDAATPDAFCPYDRPSETAARLCAAGAGGECDGQIGGLFVVGFAVDDPQAVGELNTIAEAGGTCASPGGNCAFLVGSGGDETARLREALSAILDRAAPGTTTRTVSAFAGATPGITRGGQAQFNTGFRIQGHGEPWTGVLERRRFECDETNVPVEQAVEPRDRFHEVLDARSTPRRLLTVVPNNANHTDQYLVGDAGGIAPIGGGGGARPRGGRGSGPGGRSCTTGPPPGAGPPGIAPVQTGLTLSAFATTNGALSRQHLGVGTDALRNQVINWVHGVGRPSKMGDIYHSSPVVVGPPLEDLADESYNAFRLRPEVASRPKVVYVGTNDGVMHAFLAEDHTVESGPYAGTYQAGHELWGFVPPAVFKSLNAARSGHVYTVDGTPVVKDIFFRRGAGESPDGGQYHTVMIFGLRGGGGAYLALDVTDPLEPRFLWQLAHDELGLTYGIPGMGQVLVRDSTGNLREIAMALLPGGAGEDLSTSTCGGVAEVGPDGRLTKPLGCPSRGKGRPPANAGTLNARENMRCWSTRGRSMYFIDPATGEVLSMLDSSVFNSPVTGGVSFFTGDVGTIATRAFMTDADGVLWRIDFSDPNPANWDADPFFDMFWDLTATEGQPAYFPPILSSDEQGRVIVIQATGNIDELDGLRENRVVSLREDITFDENGVVQEVEGFLNWEIRLAEGEQVTGPLELFDGKVYFGSFTSTNDITNACAYGHSKIWAVEYVDSEMTAGQPTPIPVGAMEDPDAPGTFLRHLPPIPNQVVMGVRVTQRPTCSTLQEATETDPYFGARTYQRVTQAARGEFMLVAQVSGGGTAGVTGSSIAEYQQRLPAPAAFTRVTGVAGSID
ncbi:MAG: hypothetical protein KF901_17355 [Myxococcales bacterium]|nr:hypothetical protein [Myxococcales bacterium]